MQVTSSLTTRHSDTEGCENSPTDVQIGNYRCAGKSVTTGFQFDKINISQNARIISSNLTLVSSHSNGMQLETILIAPNINGNLNDFMRKCLYHLNTGYHGIQNVSWNIAYGWLKDNSYSSPDISSLIKSKINDKSWLQGNTIVIIVAKAGQDGSACRKAFADKQKIQLTINYRTSQGKH